MSEKHIKSGMEVLVTGIMYGKSNQGIRPPFRAVVIGESDYDEEWGPSWIVRSPGATDEELFLRVKFNAPEDFRISEMDIYPIPAIATKPTSRGFGRGEFKDVYDATCSIQESSLATQHAIWLGVSSERMHLNRGHVAALLPLLEKFVRTGEL